MPNPAAVPELLGFGGAVRNERLATRKQSRAAHAIVRLNNRQSNTRILLCYLKASSSSIYVCRGMWRDPPIPFKTAGKSEGRINVGVVFYKPSLISGGSTTEPSTPHCGRPEKACPPKDRGSYLNSSLGFAN